MKLFNPIEDGPIGTIKSTIRYFKSNDNEEANDNIDICLRVLNYISMKNHRSGKNVETLKDIQVLIKTVSNNDTLIDKLVDLYNYVITMDNIGDENDN